MMLLDGRCLKVDWEKVLLLSQCLDKAPNLWVFRAIYPFAVSAFHV